MKKFAQVLNDKLHWKFEQDKAPDFAADIQIVEITGITPEPQEGWDWDGQAFIAPAAPDPVAVLAAVKTNALDRIATFAKSKRALIAGTSDDAEIAGWSNKLRIAQAIIAGTATDGEKAVFQAEITARGIKGETLDIFTQKVIKNAGLFAQAVGLIDGLKRKAQDSVSAAKPPEEVAAVLDGMKAQVEAAFSQLMQSAK